MKTINLVMGAAFTVLVLGTTDLYAQNVGIGVSNPQSKLTVNGNLAIGSGYNTAAPTNGALIQGWVGIGTTAPLCPLHVAPVTTNNATISGGTRVWFDPSLPSHFNSDSPPAGGEAENITAYFGGGKVYSIAWIAFSGTVTASDARLKNIIGRSDSAKDLQTLMKIDVTDYTMKDTVTYGNKPSKKVIAQQVEEVYPAAVKPVGAKGFTFVPDIYVLANSVKPEKSHVYTIGLTKKHGLKDGDTVRLITPQNSELNATVHVVDDKTFSVTTKEPLGDKVFVYGKECPDLKGVDYDAISMLNVSATQELAKKVEVLEEQNSDLQNQAKQLTAVEAQQKTLVEEQGRQITDLNTKIAAQNTKIEALETANAKPAAMASEIEAVKKTVATLQEKENDRVRTVVLSRLTD